MRGYRADVAFDGERELPGGALVLVEGETIVGVELGGAPAPDGTPVTYRPGTALLPGLIDTHVHLCGDDSPRALDQLPELDATALAANIDAALRVHLATGVTTVRDLGDYQWAVVERRRSLDGGPAVIASGPPITSVDGHCWNMGGEVTGVDALRRAVRERAERGADIVKIMASGGLMTRGTDILAGQFTDEELHAAVDEAHRVGLPITAHAHALVAVEQVLAAGVDGIEHCSCLTAQGLRTPPGLAERLAAAGTVVCPTMGRRFIGEPPPHIKALEERLNLMWEDRLAQVADLYRAGVRLVSGGDSGINPAKPHGILLAAIADLVDAGLPAEAALASATGRAADGCGVGDRTGRLRAGLRADLLLVSGNPLTDSTALEAVELVVCRGRENS